ncbi:MAG: GIN domain-containing protein, partial [Candidatus Promineifilaceae bacterium]
MRSRTFSTILFLGIALTLLTACTALIERAGDLKTVAGSGNVVTETRPVSGFSAVSLRGMGSVIIDQNGSESLQISADDNFLPYLKTEVRGDTLYIEASDDAEGVVFTNVTDLTFRINAAALEAIELAGAGSIEVNDLDTETWRVTVPGAGSITVSGRTAEQTVEMEGAGSYNAENLESQEAT